MTESEVHDAVVIWLAQASGVTSIKTEQGVKRPALPYLSVRYPDVIEVQEHHACIEYEETPEQNSEGENIVIAKPVIETEWVFQLQSYGPDPYVAFRALRSFARVAGPHLNFDRRLILFNVGNITYAPEYVKNAWEPRAVCILQVRGYTRDGFVIDVIDEAPINVNRI